MKENVLYTLKRSDSFIFKTFSNTLTFYGKKKILRNDLKEMDRIPEGKLVVQGGMSREIG